MSVLGRQVLPVGLRQLVLPGGADTRAMTAPGVCSFLSSSKILNIIMAFFSGVTCRVVFFSPSCIILGVFPLGRTQPGGEDLISERERPGAKILHSGSPKGNPCRVLGPGTRPCWGQQ